MPKDQIINIKDVNVKVQRLEAEYNKQGYILARVADIRMLPDGTLLLLVNEGIVEDFKVKGNVKTKDYVITREMKLKKASRLTPRMPAAACSAFITSVILKT